MDNKLWIIAVIATIIGALDSLYLTWSKLAHQAVFCGGSGECETVQNSSYASVAGIPVAILGLGAYLVILGLLVLERRGGFWLENGPIAVFGISLVGFLYSLYLTYIELAVLHAICPYCVVSAVVITVIFVIAIIRLVHAQPEAIPTKRISRGG